MLRRLLIYLNARADFQGLGDWAEENIAANEAGLHFGAGERIGSARHRIRSKDWCTEQTVTAGRTATRPGVLDWNLFRN
ncbi:hypothetical protein BSZ21_14200 [Bradyrhizobium canariense]|nr:hypothetical protein BSZ21_14200 [Bradyrhizobium canariense]